MGFVNPNAWLLAALLAVLIALYLWERQRRRVDVPSLLLWEAIPEAIVRSSRFRPDLLFILQCALLTALIAGLADPYLVDRHAPAPGRRVFVLDLSASMQAREGRDTRFDRARAALRQRVAGLGPADEAMLIAAGPHPHVVAAFTSDREALLVQLANLEPVDAGADLHLALALADRAARRDGARTAIEVFTDVRREEIAAAWHDDIDLFPVGETDDNLAIESLQVFQGRFQDPRDAHAYVAVRNFSRREAHGFLTFELDDRVLSRQGFSLAPRSASAFPMRELPGAGVLHAALEVDDALAADNHAYGWVQPGRPVRVLVVSRSDSLPAELRRIAGAIANLEFRFAAPEAYAGNANGADVVLFHRCAPPLPADTASLYVFPPPDGGPFPIRATESGLRILDWNHRHAALKGLTPEVPFSLGDVRLLDPPAWADVLLASRSDGRDVALAFAGERAGRRTAVIAFDVAADGLLGADHVNLLLFFLNLLDWLAPPDAAVRIARTGTVEVLDHLPLEPRRIVDPRSRESTLPAGGALTLEPLYAGEYVVRANGTSARVLANFLDPEESDIGRPAASAVAAARRSAPGDPPRRATAGFGLWLYAAAAGLMLVEWFAARRRA